MSTKTPPLHSLIEVAITRSIPLADSEIYILLTILHKTTLLMMSWTQGLLLLEADKSGSIFHFREDGFKSMLGYVMVSQEMTREVGIYTLHFVSGC